MTEQNQEQENGSGALKWVIGGIVAIAVFLGGGLVIIFVAVGGILGDDGGGDGTGGGVTCTPGDPETSSVEIPEEYREYVASAAAESGFSIELIAAQIYHESSWQEDASSGQADGIAQFTPATWAEYGDGGDVWDPEDAIDAQGRYMADMRELFEDVADDEEHLTELALAGYNAGGAMPAMTDYDLSEDTLVEEHGSGHDYVIQTYPYMQNIMAAADGDYASDCSHGGSIIAEGDIVEAAMTMAYDEWERLPRGSAADYGREEAKPEYVETALDVHPPHEPTSAFFTDCGAFVSTVMRASGVDPEMHLRGTGHTWNTGMGNYFENSDDYEVFTPDNEGELEAGDILWVPGHIYIYTGEREPDNPHNESRAVGAMQYHTVPSGHPVWITEQTQGESSYRVARHVDK